MQLDKKRLIAAGATVLVLALLVIVPILIFSGSEELELKNYVKIDFGESYSGYASPTITLQDNLLDAVVDEKEMEAFASTVLGIQKESIQNWGDALDELFGKSDVPKFSDLFTISFAERYTNVKNGDILIANLEISYQYSNKVTFEKIEEVLDVVFDKTELSILVNSLPEVQITKVDLSQLFSVDFGEYDGYSTPTVKISTTQFESSLNETLLEQWRDKRYSDLLNGKYKTSRWFDAEFTETYNNLSNGDTVTVRLIASQELTKAGITLEDIEQNLLVDFGTREHTFTVSGLETPKNVLDIFEGIEKYVVYGGVNGTGYIGYDQVRIPSNYTKQVGDLYFSKGSWANSIKIVQNNKKIGEITYHIDGSKLTEGDALELTAKCPTAELKALGYVVPTTRKNIFVPDLGEYLTSLEQLTPEVLEAVKTRVTKQGGGKEIVKLYFAKCKPGVECSYDSPAFIKVIYYKDSWFRGYYIDTFYDIVLNADGTVYEEKHDEDLLEDHSLEDAVAKINKTNTTYDYTELN